jgi:hypothetical protein
LSYLWTYQHPQLENRLELKCLWLQPRREPKLEVEHVARQLKCHDKIAISSGLVLSSSSSSSEERLPQLVSLSHH